MKRFEFKVALHIFNYFSAFYRQLSAVSKTVMVQHYRLYSLFVGAGMHLYRIQFKQITLLRRLTDGLRYNDMTQNLIRLSKIR